jgi:hypothetical protein
MESAMMNGMSIIRTKGILPSPKMSDSRTYVNYTNLRAQSVPLARHPALQLPALARRHTMGGQRHRGIGGWFGHVGPSWVPEVYSSKVCWSRMRARRPWDCVDLTLLAARPIYASLEERSGSTQQ